MRLPLLSVIVVIHKCEKYLPKCIESIRRQKLKNIEIILVNDGSPDKCPTICERFAQKDKRIKVVHQENGGLVSARKAGLRIATGFYVGYVDGDDWVEPDMFLNLLTQAVEHHADVVVSGHKEEINGEVVEILWGTVPVGVYRGKQLEQILFKNMINCGKFSQFGVFTYFWDKIFKRSILLKNQNRVADEIFMGDDAACVYPCLLDSKTVCVTNTSHYHYCQRIDSSVKKHKNLARDLEKLNILYKYLNDTFKKSKYYKILLPQLQLYLLSLMTVRLGRSFLSRKNHDELSPFLNIPKQSRIVICGAGTFGQHLYRRLKKSRNYQLVGWIDELAHEYQKAKLPVKGFLSLQKNKFDIVVIAFIDEAVAEKIHHKLNCMGIPSRKIRRVSHHVKHVKTTLKHLGLRS